jgi:predicted Holliday junction resolvase-like endonuclease
MDIIIYIILLCLIAYLLVLRDKVVQRETRLKEELKNVQVELINTQETLGDEREKGRTLLSQKKSSETRLGNIAENLVPFLQGCPHDPKTMTFLGAPIDFVVFNFDEGYITFLEVKSGNSKPTKRQKIIKNLVQAGRVFYEEIRVDEKGVRHKSTKDLPKKEKTNVQTKRTV